MEHRVYVSLAFWASQSAEMNEAARVEQIEPGSRDSDRDESVDFTKPGFDTSLDSMPEAA